MQNRLVLGILATLGLLISGCIASSATGPEPSPTATTTPSPTVTSTPVALNVDLVLTPGAKLLQSHIVQRKEGLPAFAALLSQVVEQPRVNQPAFKEGYLDIVEYDLDKRDWKRMFRLRPAGDPDGGNRIRAAGDLTGDGVDEVIIEAQGGSGGYLTWWIFGLHDGVVKQLFERGLPSRRSVHVEGARVIENESGQATQYVWQGSYFVGTPLVRGTRPQGPGDKVIRYSIREGRINAPKVESVDLGSIIQLIRTDNGPDSVRYFTGLDNVGPDVFRASREGETGITLIPNVYDWEHAHEIKITVVKP